MRVIKIIIFMGLVVSAHVHARPYIPPALEAWQSWVLHNQVQVQCPFLYNKAEHQCVWPGQLALNIDSRSGRFQLQADLFAQAWITLPGDDLNWPVGVTVNQQPAQVSRRNGRPAVYLPAGQYEIHGEWAWPAPPRALAIPEQAGLLKLFIQGQEVNDPNLSNTGTLLLAREDSEVSVPTERDTVSLQVFRKLTDRVPLTLETHLQLTVSGSERELQTGPALLPGFKPVALDSPLPARIEPDGQLRLQLQPGRWTIRLRAQHLQDITRFAITSPLADWPAQEIWVFDAQPALRTAQVEGVPLIDGSQTQLPPEWQGLPAYLITPDSEMHLNVLHRGDPNPAANQLTLHKDLWLDFAGTGGTVRDTINGSLFDSWRLQTHPAYQLGRVELNGASQLITRLADDQDAAGVELRTQSIQLTAVSRVDQMQNLPVSGWQASFESVNQNLHLPPGWSVLHVSGADRVSGTWLSGWNLWDMFIVLIISVALAKVVGTSCGVLALLTLLFTYQRDQAPLISWLIVLVGLTLLPHIEGKVARWVQGFTVLGFVVLLLVLLPYLVQQARQVVYPQLASHATPSQFYSPTQDMAVSRAPPQEAAVMMDMEPTAGMRMSSTRLKQESVAYSVPDYDPSQKVQVGPGLPDWQWRQASAWWSGPVDVEEGARWLLVSPLWNRLGDLISLLLPCLLALWLVRRFRQLVPGTGSIKWRVPGSTAAIALVMVCGLPSQSVQADVLVDNELLKTLEQRLMEPARCLPDCASIEAVQLSAAQDSLSLTIRLHALQDIAFPMPARIHHWQPQTVLVDGQRTPVYRDAQGQLLALVKKGSHDLQLRGTVTDKNTIDLDFSTPIHNLTHSLQGWKLTGIPTDRQTSQILQLQRQAVAGESRTSNRLLADPMPAHVTVTRRIQLGLEWTVQTEVRRVAPGNGVIQLAIPLLDGEAPNSGQLTAGGQMDVRLSAQQQQVRWESMLAIQPELRLTAPESVPWHEVWSLQTGAMWHSQASGIPPVQQSGDQHRSLWQPWPGESVLVSIDRPTPVEGRELALDKVEVTQSFGRRATDHQLELMLRATYGGQFTLPLPDGIEPKRLLINGSEAPISYSNNRIQIPVKPGEQTVRLEWQTPQSMQLKTASPAIELPHPSTNIHLTMHLPGDRWTLLTGGPSLGPAILFWGVFAVVILIAIGLGKSALTPLKPYEWLLLSLGVATINVYALVVIIAWFVIMQLRGRLTSALQTSWFNTMQSGLMVFSVIALFVMISGIPLSLLASPEMYITGNGSSAHTLRWYHDQSSGPLPQAWVISLPLLVYRVVMLLWSLWLAFALIRWIRWGWAQLGVHGWWYRKAVEETRTDNG